MCAPTADFAAHGSRWIVVDIFLRDPVLRYFGRWQFAMQRNALVMCDELCLMTASKENHDDKLAFVLERLFASARELSQVTTISPIVETFSTWGTDA